MLDFWIHLNESNQADGWRCRWCRGCRHFGTVGGTGCCNYFLNTGKRRETKFGEPCGKYDPLPGYKKQKEHEIFCNGTPPPTAINAEKRRNSLFYSPNWKGEPIPATEPKKRGKPPTWDVEYGKLLYMDGCYLFEIAEILDVPRRKIQEYAFRNLWHTKLKSRKPCHRHDIEAEKAKYAEYLKRKNGA